MTLNQKPTGVNFAKLCKVEFTDKSNVNLIDYFHSAHLCDVTLNYGCSWEEIYFTPGTGSHQEGSQDSDAGTSFNQRLTFSIPKNRSDIAARLISMKLERLIVKATYCNGSVKIVGSVDTPLIFHFDTRLANGFDGFDCFFTGQTEFPSYYHT
jgi:hypothetical protein